ncbi:ABC transporter substrate-binding protein [Neopusillimonas maritima]|jgi:branched-chain amino acid transport system substrate-binding protein|uniref:ABC transporter substrate-binding protein n=1 Tax=Neopusillimonas maritima TaxID=2026239 RepID=A0A3A1YS26_9BURK|nr:ABC transporter substrate-binding protein [Neopusillimonas maritima]RII83321.1 ABC transporter substrate-binding protein [Neopusillimonas maritima]RIY40059.1 ABC transporter substrate-binding protein [Neopusillimonas maritima]|tara:strand:- start:50967 stop:52127 length:1161 start_codon:yes stop_codon:yes gene_type:complete
MYKKFIRNTLLASCLGLGVASFAYAQETIKIGIIQPLTGSVAASGNFVLNGAQIAVDYINNNGGVLDKKLELVVADNKSNPTESANAAEKLIVRDKVPVMIGSWGSTFTLATLPKLMEYKIPMVVETAGADKITTSGNPYVFRISPTNDMEATSFSRHIEPLGIKKADILVVNNDWGLGSADSVKRILKEKGLEVGKVLTMDHNAQDMSSQLSEIRGSDADSLFIVTAVEQLTLVLKQAEGLGLKKENIITLGGSQSPDQLIAHAGGAAEGTMHNVMFAPWFPEASADPEKAKFFVEEWNKRGLEKAGLTESFRGFDAVRTVAAAIEKAGEVDSDKIRDALWEVELTGLNGPIAFRKSGPEGRESGQSYPNTFLVRIQDGEISLVE